MKVKTDPLLLAPEDHHYRAAFLQRELRTSQRWCTGYRRLALAGWIAFTAVLLWQPDAHAETLPRDSVACVDEAALVAQMSRCSTELAQGCVYVSRDYSVRVEDRNSVWVEDADMLVWVDVGVLRP
jgi:hypothetical protein